MMATDDTAPSAALQPIAFSPALLLFLLWPGFAAGQVVEPAPVAAEPFVESIDVDVVNVEVYVTDKRGNRTLGLTKEDFELYVDGRPVPITNFYSVAGSAGSEGEPAAVNRAHPLEPAASSSPPEDQRLHLVVYIDNFNLRQSSRNRTLRAVRTFLRTRLGPSDRVMLVSYDRSLHVRHPFTSDVDRILRQLHEIEGALALASQLAGQRQDLIERIEVAEGYQEVLGHASNLAFEIENDMRSSLRALEEQVTALSGLPGRKAILYVSDGLPMFPGRDLFELLGEKLDYPNPMLEVFQHDLTRDFARLTGAANAHRVTFYTLDAEGLRVSSYMDASKLASGSARGDQIHLENIQSPLRFMARETGGLAILDTNDALPMLERVAEDFTSYYSLGFMPATIDESRDRKIKVRLLGAHKDLRVRVRKSFRGKSVETRMRQSTLATLAFGYQNNSLAAELSVGSHDRQDDGTYLVSVQVRIPISRLTFLPLEATHRGRVRLFVAAQDSKGQVSDVSDAALPIEIPREEWDRRREDWQTFEFKLQMRGGQHRLALGVRDEIGATTSLLAQQVWIGI